MTIVMCTNKSCKFNQAGEICGKDKIGLNREENFYGDIVFYCNSVELNELPKEDNMEITK